MLVATLNFYFPGAAGDGDNPFGKLAVSLGIQLEAALRATFPGMHLEAPRAWACDPDLFNRERPRMEVMVTVPTGFQDQQSLLNDTLAANTEVWRDLMAADPAGVHLRMNNRGPLVVFLVDYCDIDKIVVSSNVP